MENHDPSEKNGVRIQEHGFVSCDIGDGFRHFPRLCIVVSVSIHVVAKLV